MLGNFYDLIKVIPALNTIFVTWQWPPVSTYRPHIISFGVGHWYLTGTSFIVRESRVSCFDSVSGPSHLDRRALSLSPCLGSPCFVVQPRTVFLSMQVVLQLLVISHDAQQPLASVGSPAACRFISCCVVIKVQRKSLALITPHVHPHSPLVITSSSQPLWSCLPIIKKKNDGRGICSWQTDSCVAAGVGVGGEEQAPHRSDHH